MRRPKTQRVARTRAGGEWTEASYWGFIRSGLRQISRRWPPIARTTLQAARRKYVGLDRRRKWQYRCASCRQWYYRESVQVDHVVPCGELRSYADIGRFVERLFCEREGLRVLCTNCHTTKHGEKNGSEMET